jgi:hypothetical protein
MELLPLHETVASIALIPNDAAEVRGGPEVVPGVGPAGVGPGVGPAKNKK